VPARIRAPLTLQRALERALLVGCAATTSGCCGLFFTRWVEGYEYVHLTRIDAEQVPPELRDPARRYAADPDLATCEAICGGETVSCRIAAVQAGQGAPGAHLVQESAEPLVAVCRRYSPAQCVDHIPSGRAPETLACVGLPRLESAAAYFARSAYLEAASVHAFRTLAAELRRHRAPLRLVRATERAAADERRHARAFQRLARRAGQTTPRVGPAATAPRTLLELARENAAEGCVLETYSALVAAYQARHAVQPALRRTLSRIAREEAEHARLSWQLWSWCLARVDESSRALLRQELRDASVRLAWRLPDLRQQWAKELGLPSLKVAREMFACLSAELWEFPRVASSRAPDSRET